MSFWQITGFNMCSLTIEIGLYSWMSGFLLSGSPGRGVKRLFKGCLAGLFLTSFLSVMATVFYLTGVLGWRFGVGSFLWTYFVLACVAFFLWFLHGASLRDSFLCVLMLELLCSCGEIVSELYTFGNFYHLEVSGERLQYLIWMLGIRPACIFMCGLAIKFSGLGGIYKKWIEQERIHRGILTLLLIYPVLHFGLDRVANGSGPRAASLMLPLFLLLMIHVIFVYVGRDRQQKQFIMTQQASLKQQAIYIEKLEQIQSELRRFRHDFKNMTAGMYLQAKEGDLDAVSAFIQEMTGDFDRQVGGQIRLLNQLGNIHMLEVKSLLLDKLEGMQRDEIPCELEVYGPFENTRMRSTDLCRCLGILVDNAMDEVRGRKDARIHLMISINNGCTTFRVRNTLYGTVNFERLGTAGYTTKGEGHGIGLESYRRILEKYDFVFPFTAIQDGCFVQELKIRES